MFLPRCDISGTVRKRTGCSSIRMACTPILAVLAVIAGAGRAQESWPDDADVSSTVIRETEFDSSMNESIQGRAIDMQYSLPSPAHCDRCEHPIETCGCSGTIWPRLGMYLKAGPSFQLSNGLFESTQAGYGISFGGRDLLVPANRQIFFDLGGSYLSAFGRGRNETIAGVIDRSLLGPLALQDFLDMSLEEISRASVHAAVGWYHDFSETPQISQLITTRFGGRVSHIRGHFREQPTEALQNAIDTAIALGDTFTLARASEISETDTAAGVFAGLELESTRRLHRGATYSFLVDAEFASDWIDLRNYADSSLVTASLMFGLSVSR